MPPDKEQQGRGLGLSSAALNAEQRLTRGTYAGLGAASGCPRPSSSELRVQWCSPGISEMKKEEGEKVS